MHRSGNGDVEKLRMGVDNGEFYAIAPRRAAVLCSVKKLGYALPPNRTDTSLEMPGSCMVTP